MHRHANFTSKLNYSRHTNSTSSPLPVITATLIPHRRRCPLSPPPLFQSPPFKLNHASVVRSQEPNHRKKNHVETWSVASAIYRQSLAIVSHQAATFPTNLKSIWHYRWVPLAIRSLPDYTGLKSEVYSSSYSKFRWTSIEVPASKLHSLFYLQLHPNFTNTYLYGFYLIID
jgi:hypothetical protein